MNAVKVVGGLVEIGAAFKFLNTAELGFVTPENAWFDAQVVLTVWVVLAAVCGLYLLGLFRTDHDHDEVKVGPGRLIFGSLVPGPGPLPGPRPLRPAAAEPGLGPPDRRPPAARRRASCSAADRARRRRGRGGPARRGQGHARTDPDAGRARGEELPRRALGDELRRGPGAGRGREASRS